MQASSSAKAQTRKFGVGKSIAYLLIIFFIAFIALEMAWRAFLYSTGRGFFDDPNEFTSPFFTTYEEPPPTKWESTAWYRNAEVPVAKPENEIRIICFGGSTTVNQRAGVSYSALLDEMFSESTTGPTVRVLNAGADGFSTAQTLVNLSLRNLELSPDIVFVYHNINDLSVKDFGDWVTSDYANKYKSDFYLGFRHRTGFLAALVKMSRLARFAVSSIDALAFPQNQYGEAGRTSRTNDHAQVLTYFRNNLRSIAAIAREHGIRLVLASQAAHSELRRVEGFAAFNRAIEEIAREEGVEFVDVANIMTDNALFLEDQIHYTRPGVERLAEILYPSFRVIVDELTAGQ